MSHIVTQGNHNNPPENSYTPVHGRRVHTLGQGEEAKYQYHQQDHDRNGVTNGSKLAHTPARRRQWLITPPSNADTRDGNNVGGEKGGGAEGHNGVESHRGSDVD